MRHHVRRSAAVAGALVLAAIGLLAGAQPASAAGGTSTTTTLTVPATVDAGDVLTGTVSVDGLSSVVPDPTVQVSVDGGPATDVPVVLPAGLGDGLGAGVGTVSVPTTGLVAGTHTIVATFARLDVLEHLWWDESSDQSTFTVVPTSVPWTLSYAGGTAVGATLTHAVLHAVGTGQTPGASVELRGRAGDGSIVTIATGTADARGAFDVSGDVVAAGATVPGVATAFSVVVRAPGADPLTSAVISATTPLASFRADLDTPAAPGRGVERVTFTTSIARTQLGRVDDEIDAAGLGSALDEGLVQLLVDGAAIDPSTIALADGAAGVVEGSFPAPAAGTHTAQIVIPAIAGVSGAAASPTRAFTILGLTFTPVVHHDGPVHPGGSITVSGSGVQPDAEVTVVLHSTPVVLATVTADATGTFSATATVPAGTAVGAHSIVVTASAAGRADVTGTAPLTVTAAPATAGAAPEPSASDAPTSAGSSAPTTATRAPAASGELAATGAASGGLVWLAVALVLAGAGAVLVARRAARG